MGQKISVNLFRAKKRLGNVTNNSGSANELQRSVWFANKSSYSKLYHQDAAIRAYLFEKLADAGLAQVVIRRFFRKIEITLFAAKPGIIIGKGGSNINSLRADLLKEFKLSQDLKIEIQEFKDPYKSSEIIAYQVSESLKRGMPYRRVAKMMLEKIRYSGVLGAKISIKGRLNGAEIARKEDFAHGSIPRHTIDSNIDFAYVPSKTKTGVIGVKVWLYKGDKFKNYS